MAWLLRRDFAPRRGRRRRFVRHCSRVILAKSPPTPGAPTKAVKRKTELTPQDTRLIDGNQFDMNGN
jgi:hypothetical protein